VATTRALEAEVSSDQIALKEPELLETQPFASGWRLWVMRLSLVALIVVAWELAAGDPKREMVLVDKFWISQPSDIVGRVGNWIERGTLGFHMAITLQEMAMGFTIGSVLGVSIGFLMGRSLLLARLFDPFIIGFNSIPKLALAPLFILWFGVGLEPKVVLVTTVVFFLVFLNTYAGVRDTDRELVDIVRLMGASQRDLLSMVVLPSASPWILTGLKLAVPYSLISAVVGELMASNKGLGFLLINAQGQFDTAGVFAAIFILMFMGLIINEVVNRAEARLLRWKSAGSGH
jgi:NitT/TauT family transport system permease protein